MEGERFSIPRLGLSGEFPEREQEPPKYFKIDSYLSFASGGFEAPTNIPLGMQNAIRGLRCPILRIEKDESGLHDLVVISVYDIAAEMDADDLEGSAGNYWQGYADAFRDKQGQVPKGTGEIKIWAFFGEIQEGEEGPDFAEPS